MSKFNGKGFLNINNILTNDFFFNFKRKTREDEYDKEIKKVYNIRKAQMQIDTGIISVI